MTKVCTAYTACKVLEELGLGGIENAKNMYFRVSKMAAFMAGTSAYLVWDHRINLYDLFHAMMLPSGNDAAIVIATEIGRWLFIIGDKQKDHQLPNIGRKGKINNFSNNPKDSQNLIIEGFRS